MTKDEQIKHLKEMNRYLRDDLIIMSEKDNVKIVDVLMRENTILTEKLTQAQINQSAFSESLDRCLREAEEWIHTSRGCKPCEIAGYDGWAHKARELLSVAPVIE